MDAEYIQTQDALNARVRTWPNTPWLALDTEFMRESTYYPVLCLIQVADSHGVVLIDPLAGLDLTPVWAYLNQPGALKILHGGDQDGEILTHSCQTPITPIFDTQIAAHFLGLGAQISYAELVKQQLGITLDKSQTRTNWQRRPLNAQQLHYAAEDVRHLPTLYQQLSKQLDQRGWLDACLEDSNHRGKIARYIPRWEQLWTQVNGWPSLHRPGELAVLQALTIWREQRAQQRNRPKRWVLPDATLVALATRSPDDTSAIAQLLQQPTNHPDVRQLQQLIATYQHQPDPAPPPNRLQYKTQLQHMATRVTRKANELGLDPALLLSRKKMLQILHQQDATPLCPGWRWATIGATLQQWLRTQPACAVNSPPSTNPKP